ncbi:MAG: beta-lactamase family protein [Fluviicola sp.]|nr:beta-lactamase family protein [Fluviicola sp.]
MRIIILLSSVILLSNIAKGQKTQTELLDSLFTALYNQNSFNGNVLIAEKGNVIFQKSYGLADEESKQYLNLQTKFELASVSKQFTAMGIVLLEKMGKLTYDDNISKFIPELSFYKNITVRNLLNHTSGLPDYIELFDEKWDKTKFATNQDIVNLFAKHKPNVNFKAGKRFEYSNTGYALLGLIIACVSEKPYGQFLTENIFKPLEMENTFVYRSRYEPQKIENYALGYVTDSLGNKVLPNSFGKEYYSYYLDGIVGDGMVNSTLEDLLKWDRALYSTILINEKDKEIIFSSFKTKDGKQTNYGFGWLVGINEKYGKIANHSGEWAGYKTFIERHLDNDKTIILLQNNSTIKTVIPVREVRNILYNEIIRTSRTKQITVSSEELDKYTGVYSTRKFPLKITIFKNGNTLMAQATGQRAFPLNAYENHVFKFDSAGITMTFNLSENSLEMTQGKQKTIFKKE